MNFCLGYTGAGLTSAARDGVETIYFLARASLLVVATCWFAILKYYEPVFIIKQRRWDSGQGCGLEPLVNVSDYYQIKSLSHLTIGYFAFRNSQINNHEMFFNGNGYRHHIIERQFII
jgi:hypothetical protein